MPIMLILQPACSDPKSTNLKSSNLNRMLTLIPITTTQKTTFCANGGHGIQISPLRITTHAPLLLTARRSQA